MDSPQIGPFIQQYRKQAGLTLDALAKSSGVSKSMLSQIERGQTNPTLATVWAMANALKVDISELIGARKAQRGVRIEIASASYTPEIRTDDGSCIMRILSPADRAETLEWYELIFTAGGSLNSSPHARGTREHLTVLEGELEVAAGEEIQRVPTGATARYPADVDHGIRNRNSVPARALLVVTS